MRLVWIALLVIVAAGGVLRFDAAASPSVYQSKDERSYALLAKDLVLKRKYGVRGMKDPVHWVPGAPVFFAVAYGFDREAPASEDRPDVPGAYPWQAGVGTVLIVTTFWLALLMAGPVAGLIAAAAIAFYPPLISASGDLLSEPLGAVLATLALAVTILAIRDPGRLRWKPVLAGLLFAATVLTRADLALLPLVAGLAVAVAAGLTRWPEGRRPAAGAAGRAVAPFLAALLLGVLPWTIYASNDAGTFVPLSNGGGSNLFIGTYLPGDGKLFGTKKALQGEIKAEFPELRDKRYFQIRSQEMVKTIANRRPELSEEAALKAEGMANLRRYALGQPLDFAAMMAKKVWRLWGGYSVGSDQRREAPVLAYHLVLVALGFAGLLAGLIVSRRRVLLLPLGGLLYVTALNAILVSESRHNLTLLPALAAGGAAGAVLAVRALRSRSRQPATLGSVQETAAAPAR